MTLIFDPPIHPGELLRDQFLMPLGLSSGALAKKLGVPRTRIERIVREEMGISTDTALRLARYFGSTPDFWLNMQKSYDVAKQGGELRAELKAIKPHEARNDNFEQWAEQVFAR